MYSITHRIIFSAQDIIKGSGEETNYFWDQQRRIDMVLAYEDGDNSGQRSLYRRIDMVVAYEDGDNSGLRSL